MQTAPLEQLVEGWTDRITQQLLNNGVAVDLTGCAVELQLFERSREITLTGTTGVLDAATGKVYYDPGAQDLLGSYSPLEARWKVTDAGAKVSFFANGVADTWIVRKP